MEQQRISVAKAGLVSSLSARASVIAAANPKGGSYDKGKTIVENLRMSPAILSRFDLVFILVDTQDDSKDREISRHVMELHRAAEGKGAPAVPRLLRSASTGVLEPGPGKRRDRIRPQSDF